MPTIDDYVRELPAPSQFVSAGSSCSICYEPFTDAVQLPCRGEHIFCRGCIQEWLEDANTCPLDRELLIEYDDENPEDDGAGGNDIQDSNESESLALPLDLAAMCRTLIIEIALKVAFCRGVHSLTERGNLATRMHTALDSIGDKTEPTAFNLSSLMVSIEGLVDVAVAVKTAVDLVEEAPSDHVGYQRIGVELTVVKGMIATIAETIVPTELGERNTHDG
ncbi:hypothetical protein CLAFUW4_04802 [Fulvia fulva]|uniref:RING-type domain-containing protein n=1 Tax=Passalora fulva TaxID=5499 RepID=A0A9Q8PIC8_PASFU|nr:uncharacterized protein CLAFUR5_12100 [Fulvia fulva]KAK4627206.1 hypothetical protein CLAFUR4_04788 [Fulvia fulva]KAK4627638.1 hypothetical protein CLAFUR0_04792 [Fulvia fulva]UJO23189.1 hypothetical protein CLAFUR5_12100 [Fulvia fulva]WPV13977.1 hypothetical protein CLAFUW4_04802 [Fulvia fulva]WPV29279.1 hypothetical protein CLAFUW7_04796 [Fulvia fulva]